MRILTTLLFLSVLCTSGRAQNALPAPHESAFSTYLQEAPKQSPVLGIMHNIPDSLVGKLTMTYAAASVLNVPRRETTVEIAPDGSFAMALPESYPANEVFYWIDDLLFGSFIFRHGILIDLDYDLLKTEAPGAISYSGPDASLTEAVKTHSDSLWYWAEDLNRIPNQIWADDLNPSAQKHQRLDSVFAVFDVLDERFFQGQKTPKHIAAIIRNERTTDYLGRLAIAYEQEGLPDSLRLRYLRHRPMVMSNATNSFYVHFHYSLYTPFRAGWETDTSASQQEQDLGLVQHQLAYLDINFEPARADLHKLYLKSNDPTTDAKITKLVLPTLTTPWIDSLIRERQAKSQASADRIATTIDRSNSVPAEKGIGTPVTNYPFGANLFVPPPAMAAEELLNNLRAVFPGKALYLDFWAVWCGPCLGEFPHSAKLHGLVHDLPVEFVYLCTEYGGDQERWKQKIVKNELPGTHLFLAEAIHSELMDLFNGKGYPNYAAITATGETKKNVRMPSQLNRNKFMKLLKIK